MCFEIGQKVVSKHYPETELLITKVDCPLLLVRDPKEPKKQYPKGEFYPTYILSVENAIKTTLF